MPPRLGVAISNMKEGVMSVHTIRISFDGQIVCLPNSVAVKNLDDIVWECGTGQPFTVDFWKRSPFTEKPRPAAAAKKIKARIKGDAAADVYEYLVALYDKSSGLVFTLDPDLIIRR
jgi:hypothetical protein